MADILSKASLFLRPTKYKSGKIYGQIPQNSFADMDLVRAGTKYRMNSAGILESVASGMPAIDWRGSTPAYNGLLVERAETNLLVRSQEFDNAIWVKAPTNTSTFQGTGIQAVLTANYGVAPDGTMTADRVQLNIGAGVTSSDRSGFKQDLTVLNSTFYTAVTFVKPLNGETLQNLLDNSIGVLAANNTNTGRVSIALKDGWYCLIQTSTTGTTIGTFRYQLLGGFGIQSMDLLIWAAHLYQSGPSSYIPTTGSTASRVADAYSKTGLSAYINNTEREGTIVFCIRRDLQLTAAELMSLTQVSGSTTNRILLRTTATDQIEAVVVNGGSEVVNILSSTNQSGVLRIIFAYKDNDCQLYINGSSVGTDTGVTIPSNLAELFYGGVNVANNANFWMKLFALIPKRLSTTDVAALDAQLATAVT